MSPVLLVSWELEAEARPYIATSSALELVYFALLGAAYRRAEVSVVYPLARGVAPVLVLVVGVVALGAETTAVQALGVCLSARRPARPGATSSGRLGGRALRAGDRLLIAAYTLVDDEGIRYANAVTYLELALIVPAIGYALGIAWVKGGVGAARRGSARDGRRRPRHVGRLRPRARRAGARRGGPGGRRAGDQHRHRHAGRRPLPRRAGPALRLAGAVLVAVGVALLGF